MRDEELILTEEVGDYVGYEPIGGKVQLNFHYDSCVCSCFVIEPSTLTLFLNALVEDGIIKEWKPNEQT
jgi:hypothetical protein